MLSKFDALPFTSNPAHKRIVYTVFAAQSMFSAAMVAIFTLMSVIAADLGGSDSYAGLPSTMVTFSRAALALPLGIILDRFGRRNGLTAAYAGGILAGMVGVLAIAHGSFWLFIAASILLGTARSGAEQSRFVAAEIFPEDKQGRVIGLVVSAGTIGAVVGPLLVDPSGKLAESWDIGADAGAWIIFIVLSLLASLSIFVFLRPDPLELSRRENPVTLTSSHEKSPGGRKLSAIFSQPRVQLAVISMLIGQTVMQLLMTITGVYMKHHHHSTADISWVMLAHTLGMFGLSGVTGYLIDRFGRISMITVGAVIMLISCAIAPLSTTMPVLMLSLFLLGLGWNFCFVGGSSLLSEALSSEERGQAQGFNEMLVTLAAGVGSLISGPLYEYGSYLIISLIGGMLVLMLTGMIGRFAAQSTKITQPTAVASD